MIGLETILIDSINNKYINQSDHYGLKLILNFRIRSISNRSSLAILPTMNISSLIKINLFSSFFDLINTEDDEENIILPLRLLLTQYQSFNIEINSLIDNNHQLIKISEHIKQLFSQFQLEYENNYKSSITILQLDNNIQFSVRYFYIIQQLFNENLIVYQLPLGSVLEPIGLNQNDCISDELREFFNKINLYPNEKLFEQKREKFNRLLNCFQGIFNKDTLHYFTYTYLPYGSYRLVS